MDYPLKLSLAVGLTALTLAGCASGSPTSRLAAPTSGAVAAANTSAPVSTTIRVFENLTGAYGGVGRVVITGGIGDYGTTAPSTRAGKLNRNGNYLKFTLRHGTFLVIDRHDKTHFSKVRNCSVSGVTAADLDLSRGTGRYAGIAGTLASAVTMAQVTPRHTSGRLQGQCGSGLSSHNGSYGDLVAHGTVTQ